jgi:hypothetical protein
LQAPVPPAVPIPLRLLETAHEASLLLDRQFPWLAGAFAPPAAGSILWRFLQVRLSGSPGRAL